MNRTRPTPGRPPASDPRRLGVFVRLTADELAAIDAARAVAPAMTRAAFVRAVAVEMAERRLNTIPAPDRIADAFRAGVAWATSGDGPRTTDEALADYLARGASPR